jgi:hypothetical protein
MYHPRTAHTTPVTRFVIVLCAVGAVCLLGAGTAMASSTGGAHGRLHTFLAPSHRAPAPAGDIGAASATAPRATPAHLAVPKAVLIAVRRGTGSGLAALAAVFGVAAFLCVMALATRPRARRPVAAGAEAVALPQRRDDENKTPHLAA